MKKQLSVWVVVCCLIAVVGVVYALSITTPPVGTSSATNAGPTIVKSPEPANNEISLSPDLKHTDAYEFLDPVPLGKAAPNFTAKTADGKTLNLSQFKGKKNVVIVFYQGSFCSVCGAQLTNIQSHLSEFKKQDAEVIAISADDESHALQSVGEHGLTFPVVPDSDKKIIKSYGIANISKENIAWPSLYVIDKKGQVRLNYADRDGHRLHSNEILPVLSKITGKPAPQLTYDN